VKGRREKESKHLDKMMEDEEEEEEEDENEEEGQSGPSRFYSDL
jgi:hypothetical protein